MGLLWDRNIGNGDGEVKETEIPARRVLDARHSVRP